MQGLICSGLVSLCALGGLGGGVMALTQPSAPPPIEARAGLTLAGAHAVAEAARAYAKGRAGTGAIAIVDDGGHLILLERLDGTFPAAPDVATGKARTAAEFRKPTRTFEEAITAKGRTSMIAVAAVADFTPLQGGVPLVVGGQVVGAIGVSGAASAAEDEEIAMAGAAAMSSLAAGSAK